MPRTSIGFLAPALASISGTSRPWLLKCPTAPATLWRWQFERQDRSASHHVALQETARPAVDLAVALSPARPSATTISAALSAIMMVGVLVLPEVMVGITEASMTRRPARPM